MNKNKIISIFIILILNATALAISPINAKEMKNCQESLLSKTLTMTTTDKDYTVTAEGGFNYGFADVGSKVTKTFTMHNNLDERIIFWVHIDDRVNFQNHYEFSLEVNAYSEVDFKISFRPQSVGTFTTILTISSAGIIEVYTHEISGEGNTKPNEPTLDFPGRVDGNTPFTGTISGFYDADGDDLQYRIRYYTGMEYTEWQPVTEEQIDVEYTYNYEGNEKNMDYNVRIKVQVRDEHGSIEEAIHDMVFSTGKTKEKPILNFLANFPMLFKLSRIVKQMIN